MENEPLYEALRELQDKIAQVGVIYARRFAIERSDDWYLLKLQEELGELVAAHLKLSARARTGQKEKAALEKNLRDELADLLAQTLLFAKNQGIDPGQALQEKWLFYLEKEKAAG